MAAAALSARSWWAERLRAAWARRELRWLAAIVALATTLRIIWVLYAARDPAGLHDPVLFLVYGLEIAQGHGYTTPDGSPTAYYPVGYPAALGAVFFLVRHTPTPDNLVLANAFFQVFLSVATVVLTFEVARRLFNATVGLVSALWLAVFPNLIYHTATFLTETLFNFLVMLALLVLVSGPWRDRRLEWPRLVAFGVVLALSVLVRPISLLFLPLLPVALFAGGFGWRRSLVYGGIALAATVAVIAPWTVRNIVVMDSPIVISANLGDDLCIGHYRGAPGYFAPPPVCFEGYEGLDHRELVVQRNDDNTRRAIRFAVDHPLFELRNLSRKAYYLWENDHDGVIAAESYGDDPFLDPDARRFLSRTADVFFYFTISLGALGLAGFLSRPLDPRRLFFLLALLAFAGVPLLFFGDTRFHVPVMPLLSVAVAWLLVTAPDVAVRLARAPSGTAPPPKAKSAPRASTPGGTFGSLGSNEDGSDVEVAEGEPSMAEQDALEDP